MPSAPNSTPYGHLREIGVGADKESVLQSGAFGLVADVVGPDKEFIEFVGQFGLLQCDLANVDRAVTAVKGYVIAFLADGIAYIEIMGFFINKDVLAAGNTWGSHAAGDDSGMAGHSSGGGEYALSHMHSAYVLGAGFFADQDDFFASGNPGFGFVSGEHYAAYGGTGRGVESFGQ